MKKRLYFFQKRIYTFTFVIEGQLSSCDIITLGGRMKTIIGLLIMLLSTLTFASSISTSEYTGNNGGAACIVRLDFSNNFVSMGGVSIIARTVASKGNKIVMEGGAEFGEAKITITLDRVREPIEARLETKKLIFPIFLTRMTCSDLVRSK